jgi:AraC-like DNA-binding protein
MADSPQPSVRAWHSRIGLIEEYEYPKGRAGTDALHVHSQAQICWSLDFPGRYRYRGVQHDVPVGAVSVLDAWQPHAASDPIDRTCLAHYIVMYVDPATLRSSVDLPRAVTIRRAVHVDGAMAMRFRGVYRALRSATPLEQDERFRELAHAVFIDGDLPAATAARRPLLRARDYIAANAGRRIGLAEIAAVADLTPWHFARAFRRAFGMPPYRFQLALRIDLARRLLTSGVDGSVVAQQTGFADQGHFIRSFKRLTGTTPARYHRGAIFT